MWNNQRKRTIKIVKFALAIYLLINLINSQSWRSIQLNGNKMTDENGEIDSSKIDSENVLLSQGSSIISHSDMQDLDISSGGKKKIKNLIKKKRVQTINKGKKKLKTVNHKLHMVRVKDKLIKFKEKLPKMKPKKVKPSKMHSVKNKLKEQKYNFVKRNTPRQIKINYGKKSNDFIRKPKKTKKKNLLLGFDSINRNSNLRKKKNSLKKFIKRTHKKPVPTFKKRETFNVNFLNKKKMNVKGIEFKPLNNSDAFGSRLNKLNPKKPQKREDSLVSFSPKKIKKQVLYTKRIKVQKKQTKISKKKPTKINSKKTFKILTKKQKRRRQNSLSKLSKYKMIVVRTQKTDPNTFSIADLLEHLKMKTVRNKKNSDSLKPLEKDTLVPIEKNNKYVIDKNFFKAYLKKPGLFNLKKKKVTLKHKIATISDDLVDIRKADGKASKNKKKSSKYSPKKFVHFELKKFDYKRPKFNIKSKALQSQK